MSQQDWETCEKYSFLLFNYGQKISRENGLILVDTKYEFGKDKYGNIVLVDEIHTPDSSSLVKHIIMNCIIKVKNQIQLIKNL